MEKFLLLIRDDMDKVKALSEDEFRDCMRRMTVWIEELAQNGNYVAAEPLQTIGRYVSKEHVLSDGPFIEAKEAISGYFIIKAENLEQAAAIAQTCPRVVIDTSMVEVRQVRTFNED
jgi:hypothetical protein